MSCKQLENLLYTGDFTQNIHLNSSRCISEVAPFNDAVHTQLSFYLFLSYYVSCNKVLTNI